MRVDIRLEPGKDPRIWDTETGKEITARVLCLSLFPQLKGKVTLELYALDESGKPYVDRVSGNVARDVVQADLAYLKGEWCVK